MIHGIPCHYVFWSIKKEKHSPEMKTRFYRRMYKLSALEMTSNK